MADQEPTPVTPVVVDDTAPVDASASTAPAPAPVEAAAVDESKPAQPTLEEALAQPGAMTMEDSLKATDERIKAQNDAMIAAGAVSGTTAAAPVTSAPVPTPGASGTADATVTTPAPTM